MENMHSQCRLESNSVVPHRRGCQSSPGWWNRVRGLHFFHRRQGDIRLANSVS